jgi:hypothetical protein
MLPEGYVEPALDRPCGFSSLVPIRQPSDREAVRYPGPDCLDVADRSSSPAGFRLPRPVSGGNQRSASPITPWSEYRPDEGAYPASASSGRSASRLSL